MRWCVLLANNKEAQDFSRPLHIISHLNAISRTSLTRQTEIYTHVHCGFWSHAVTGAEWLAYLLSTIQIPAIMTVRASWGVHGKSINDLLTDPFVNRVEEREGGCLHGIYKTQWIKRYIIFCIQRSYPRIRTCLFLIRLILTILTISGAYPWPSMCRAVLHSSHWFSRHGEDRTSGSFQLSPYVDKNIRFLLAPGTSLVCTINLVIL